MGLDVWEVVEAAATKPYGFMAFRPGLVGGHCIPVDPYYLSWKAREYDFHMDFIELAARVNEEMPFYVVNRLMAVLYDNAAQGAAQGTAHGAGQGAAQGAGRGAAQGAGQGAEPHPSVPGGGHAGGRQRVLVLGVAFKRDVDDARYSPALKVIDLLRRRKVQVLYHDPYIPRIVANGAPLASTPLTAALLQDVDCVLILADHSCFDYAWIVRNARMVFDVRNATRQVAEGREKIIRL
jgi:UDP-N-acetyl-D-glucosamine dehydrogenase